MYGLAHGFSLSMIFFMYAAVFRFGALLVTLPTDNVAYVDFYDVFRVFIAIVFGGAAIAQAGAFAPNYTQARLSANRIFFLLDRKPKIDNYSTEGEKPVRVWHIYIYTCMYTFTLFIPNTAYHTDLGYLYGKHNYVYQSILLR